MTVYERGAPGAAQSGGESRIFRHAHDDPRLVALAVESRRDLARVGAAVRRRARLGRRVGAARAGGGAPAPLLRDAGVRVREIAAGPAARARDGPAMLDDDAGVIRTRAAVAALVAAVGDGSCADEVVAVEPDGDGARRRRGRAVRPRDRLRGARHRRAGAAPGSRCRSRVSTHVRLTFPVRGAPPTGCRACRTPDGAYGDPLPGNDRYASASATSTGGRPIALRRRATLPGLSRSRSRSATAGSPSCRGARTGSRSGRPAARGSSPAATCSSTRRGSGARSPRDAVRDDLRPEAQLGERQLRLGRAARVHFVADLRRLRPCDEMRPIGHVSSHGPIVCGRWLTKCSLAALPSRS